MLNDFNLKNSSWYIPNLINLFRSLLNGKCDLIHSTQLKPLLKIQLSLVLADLLVIVGAIFYLHSTQGQDLYQMLILFMLNIQ